MATKIKRGASSQAAPVSEDTPEWGVPRGWHGPFDVMTEFRTGMAISHDGIGIISPPMDSPPGNLDGVGYWTVIVARQGFEITPPDEALELSPIVASALVGAGG